MKNLLCLIFLLSFAQVFAQNKAIRDLPILSGAYEEGLDEDWLVKKVELEAGLFRNEQGDRLIISNGLLSRSFYLGPNLATVSLDLLSSDQNLLRGIKAEAEISINGKQYEVGGLKGQKNYAYLDEAWLPELEANPEALEFIGFSQRKAEAPFEWKRVRHHDTKLNWPPKGVQVQMNYSLPDASGEAWSLSVFYELYDGIPLMAKWIQLRNESSQSIRLDSFSSEILAAVEYASTVETREYDIPPPNIHVETDYAFASMEARDANHHVVHWEEDPDYSSQVSYLRRTPCLLRMKPEIGPDLEIQAGESFTSFRTFILPFDSYDRERNGLAQRRMYRTLAPWSTENPLMMHARFADWERVKLAIDQAAEAGFEMVILTFGSGFNIEDDSEEYVEKMKAYADYAKSKGVEIGGYSLLASRRISPEIDVVMKEGETATFGNSPCIGSEWGESYFKKLYNFYAKSGFSLLEHDGSYPGDYCMSEDHPGHQGYGDSRWKQYEVIADFYQWCRANGIYLNIPDYYYLAGGNKCAMGYREVNWSLPRAQQLIHTRQNIFDGTWTKGVSMGWMFVPLTEYHGGGAAATIEPLNEHIEHYKTIILSNLSAGVQACYRGPRLFDTEETKNMVVESVNWYKKHREILEGDLIHLRRADGRDLDYWLMVKPGAEEAAALVVFNPTQKRISKKIEVPLYYSGLRDFCKIYEEEKLLGGFEMDGRSRLKLSVELDAQSQQVFFFK
ncbi:MAG: alpha-galactosidase [Bacteroidia bacterium]|nr:alpha-galactosidase [Bacteroidia bacterium]